MAKPKKAGGEKGKRRKRQEAKKESGEKGERHCSAPRKEG